jgi:hypothetical protein
MRVHGARKERRLTGAWLCAFVSACGGGGSPSLPADTLAPTVTAVTPADNSERITPASSLTVTFSEAVACATAGPTALSLDDGVTPVAGATACSGNQLTFTPDAALPTNTTLTASVSTRVADLAGNHLATAFNWRIGVAPWTVQTGTEGIDALQGIAVDASGSIYTAGFTEGSYDGHPNAGQFDAVVVKFDRSGSMQWSRQLGTAADDSAYAVALDAGGNVYVAGTTEGELADLPNHGTVDMFVAKYDSNGSQLWVRQFQSDGTNLPRAMAADASGGVVVVGYTTGSLFSPYAGGNSDLFVMKLDGAGALIWGRQSGTATVDNAGGVAISDSGEVYVAGYTTGMLDGNARLGDADIFLSKYDASGNRQWTRQIGTAALDIASSLAIDGAGNLYLAGRTGGSLGAQASAGGLDAIVAKFDEAGVLLWISQFGSAADDYALCIAVDGAGNASVAGYTLGAFGANPGAGSIDMFAARLDAAGQVQWVRQWGSAADDQANGIALDSVGNVFIVGNVGDAFDGNVSAGKDDMSITKYTPDGITR